MLRIAMGVVALGLLGGLLGAAGAARAQDDVEAAVQKLMPHTVTKESRGFKALKAAPAATPAETAAEAPAAPAKPRPTATASVATPPAAVHPASAPAPAPAPVADDAAAVSFAVQFATGSAALTPGATASLDRMGRVLSDGRLAGFRFRIEGHTDTVGSAEANRALSEQRAQAVVAYLTGRYGIAADRLQAVGLGEEGLAVPTGDQVAEPRNRRVQVVNIGT